MRITAFVEPYNPVHDHYTAYYRDGLAQAGAREYVEVSSGGSARLLRGLSRLRGSCKVASILGGFAPTYRRAVDALARAVGAQALSAERPVEEGLGRFVFVRPDGVERRVCIDIMDSGRVMSTEGLSWCDLYFKTSFLDGCTYPPKVLPLPQCGNVLLGHIERFRLQRTTKKTYDLCFTTRVWGGSNELEGIEHNLRILEALAEVDCRKYLRAYLLAGDKGAAAKRLNKRGIPWSYDPLPLADHIEVMASSRLNIHRLGMHNSITWRMGELLCLGACPVLDQPPRTLWPEPLREGVHFLSLDAAPAPKRSVATDAQYAAIPERVTRFLADGVAIERIGAANQAYFDKFLEPVAVGRYICQQVADRQ